MINKEVFIGFGVALLATIFGFYLYVELISTEEFETTLDKIISENLLGKIIGLAAIPNLLVFYVFLKRKQDLRAKGVIVACFVLALLIMLAQFL